MRQTLKMARPGSYDPRVWLVLFLLAFGLPETAVPAASVPDVPISGTNQVTIPSASQITIRVDPASAPTPSNFLDDVTYTYWLSGSQLMRTGATGDGVGKVIAENIFSLSFTHPGADMNIINVVLEARVSSGPSSDPTQTKEHLETTVAMRSRSAV